MGEFRLATSRLLISPSEKMRYEVTKTLCRNDRRREVDMFCLQEIELILLKLAQNVNEVTTSFCVK